MPSQSSGLAHCHGIEVELVFILISELFDLSSSFALGLQDLNTEPSEYRLRAANIMFDPRVVRGNTWSAATLAKLRQSSAPVAKVPTPTR